MDPLVPGALRVRSEIVRLQLPEIRPDELESARKITLMFGKENAAPFMDLVPFVMPVLYFRSLFCRYSSYSFFSTGSDGVGYMSLDLYFPVRSLAFVHSS
jgi:hypothetical protein